MYISNNGIISIWYFSMEEGQVPTMHDPPVQFSDFLNISELPDGRTSITISRNTTGIDRIGFYDYIPYTDSPPVTRLFVQSATDSIPQLALFALDMHKECYEIGKDNIPDIHLFPNEEIRVVTCGQTLMNISSTLQTNSPYLLIDSPLIKSQYNQPQPATAEVEYIINFNGAIKTVLIKINLLGTGVIQVSDMAIVKMVNGKKQLYSLREQKIAKNAVLRSFDVGSGVKYEGNLYVLDDPEMEIVRMTTGKVDPSFGVVKDSDITVNWGDGVVEKNVFAHTYTDVVAVHEITFWGKRTALTRLDCDNNQLTSLDVSKNTALTRLNCVSNQLTALDVSCNVALYRLYCIENQLSALDISHNPKLSDLQCTVNQLSALDVSHNTALYRLYCNGNQLSVLDVSHNTALIDLHCHENQISILDVSHNTALDVIYCSGNQLSALDVSHNTALTGLTCYSNPFIINPSALTAMVNSLPDRNGMEQGELCIHIHDVDTISIITGKNWHPY